MQEEQHDNGFRGIEVVGSRVYVREQTCNIQCFLHHVTHFAQLLADLSESIWKREVCLLTGLRPGVATLRWHTRHSNARRSEHLLPAHNVLQPWRASVLASVPGH